MTNAESNGRAPPARWGSGAIAAGQAEDAVIVPAEDHQPRRVVIVDDDRVLRAILRSRLPALGVEVVAEAATGIEAIGVVRDLDREGRLPDAVVTDYEMPEMNGLALSRTLTAFWPELVVVLMTGSNDDVVLEAGRHAGAQFALHKDTDLPERLAQIVNAS